ncbi:hypothetical protein GW17_00028446 [Ensete ventricosum]|nr:hypothetical protein GW17_00028446 [Ensete ventricosum]
MADEKRLQASGLISIEDIAATRFFRTSIEQLVTEEKAGELRTRLVLLNVDEFNDSSDKRGGEKEEGVVPMTSDEEDCDKRSYGLLAAISANFEKGDEDWDVTRRRKKSRSTRSLNGCSWSRR